MQETTLKTAEKTSQGKTLGSTTFKNLGSTMGKGLASVAEDLGSANANAMPIDKTPYNSQLNRK